MPFYLKLVIIYLAVDALLAVLFVGRSIEITPGGAMLSVITKGLMIWAIFGAFAHHAIH